ncbi:MAG: NAD(P)H-dependent glycerol-3-phosphate dehydrogenase [Nanoarchaeota archaeon]|nr:NAD(P)H-dependent glycerol-3-phosphate dehydrogenase [Nanoarchaeota archaeon]
MKTSVIGAGPWGTAVASLLKRNNHDVKLWAYQNILDKDIVPIEGIKVTDDIVESVKDSEYIFIVLNSQFFIATLDQLNFEELKDKKFVILTKGLVHFEDSYHLSFEILEKKYNISKDNIAVLSGPNIAKEIYNQKPSAAVVASESELNDEVKNVMSSDNFTVHLSTDMYGVQWCGILKNPVAIGVGILDGLYPNTSNPKSAFITNALREMQEVGILFNAQETTFQSVAGIGDLMTTCLSGRNQKVGLMLAEGNSLDEIYELFKPQKPEGSEQIKIIYNLIKEQMEAPIFTLLYQILYEGKDIKEIKQTI